MTNMTRYLHIYRGPSGQWSGKVLKEVAGIAGCESTFAVVDEAYERFPDIEDLPIDTPPQGGTVETVEVNADALTELIDAASAGSVMDASGRDALWFGPDKAERLRAALAQVKGGSA